MTLKRVYADRSLLVAEPSDDGRGYSWTLTSILGEMLQLAEERFGTRNSAYTILGIEFSVDGPQCWFPGDCQHVIVQLSLSALKDKEEASDALAHECIHLLSPTGVKDANVLEEGLAEHFRHWYMQTFFGDGWWTGGYTHPDAVNYVNAASQVGLLLSYDSDIIRKDRQFEPTISRISAELLMKECPMIPPDLAHSLTRIFQSSR